MADTDSIRIILYKLSSASWSCCDPETQEQIGGHQPDTGEAKYVPHPRTESLGQITVAAIQHIYIFCARNHLFISNVSHWIDDRGVVTE